MAIAFLGGAAYAQSIPKYDVEKYCQDVAEVSGGSEMIFDGCFDMEQQAYNALKSNCDNIKANSQEYCDEVARVTGGSYGVLKGCIEMESSAASSKRQFEY